MTEQIINAFGLLRATVPRAESKSGVKGTWLLPASRHSSSLPGRQVEERNLQIYSNVAPLLAAGAGSEERLILQLGSQRIRAGAKILHCSFHCSATEDSVSSLQSSSISRRRRPLAGTKS